MKVTMNGQGTLFIPSSKTPEVFHLVFYELVLIGTRQGQDHPYFLMIHKYHKYQELEGIL